LAVNHAIQVRLSNQDLSKFVDWDIGGTRTTQTWGNHAVGRSTINSAADHTVTVYSQDNIIMRCYQDQD